MWFCCLVSCCCVMLCSFWYSRVRIWFSVVWLFVWVELSYMVIFVFLFIVYFCW